MEAVNGVAPVFGFVIGRSRDAQIYQTKGPLGLISPATVAAGAIESGRMDIRPMGRLSLAGILLLPAIASAQGLTGGLDGLAEALALFWGFVGIVPLLLMRFARRRREKHPDSPLAVILVFLCVLYAMSAIGLMFIEMRDFAAKFAGTVGFVVLFLAARFAFHSYPGLKNGAYAVLGLLLATLLVIPTEFWKYPLLSFERIVYVDNLDGLDHADVLRTPYGYAGRLALDDGRLLIQTKHVPERPQYSGQSPQRAWYNGIAVSLTPLELEEPGHWFEIQHYDPPYVSGAHVDGQRARYIWPLRDVIVERYRRSKTTIGYVVDASTDIDHERLLLDMMSETYGSWNADRDRYNPGNKALWGERLIKLGDIDVRSTAFLDRAFTSATSQALVGLLDLGLEIDARDSRGNTLLHRSARRFDTALLNGLHERGIDMALENDAGLTALEVAKQSADTDPVDYSQVRYIEYLESLR